MRRESYPIQAILLVLLLVVSAGCEKKIEKVSDQELRAKWAECQDMNAPGAAMIMACENYERECKRRRKELKRFVC